MKKVVVYDSYYGNTATIAEKIAKELECEHIKVHACKKEVVNDYDLVVIGSPTRMFTATKEIKEIVKAIHNPAVKIVLFDTRVEDGEKIPKFLRTMSKKFGYSNDSLEKILQKKGLETFVESEAFYVGDTEGPLLETEVEKAVVFAQKIIGKNI
jgi:flavodoxin